MQIKPKILSFNCYKITVNNIMIELQENAKNIFRSSKEERSISTKFNSLNTTLHREIVVFFK